MIEAIEAVVTALAEIASQLAEGHITEAQAAEKSRAAVAAFTAAMDAGDAAFAKRDAETDAALDAIDAAKRAGVQAHVPAPRVTGIEGVPDLMGGGDKTGSLT